MQRQKQESQTLKPDTVSPGREKEKPNIEKIQQTKANLDQVIEQLNSKLYEHFHKKQQQLIEEYKKELIAAQKQLNQLKSTTNQEQIKNKMMERKKQLERQRHQLIQTNMFFSAKCEDYKKKLSDLVADGKELQRELIFLDSQINSAHRKKYQVLSQYEQTPTQKLIVKVKKGESNHTLPLFSDRKPIQSVSSSKKLGNSVSVRDTTNKKAILQESMASKQKRSIVRNDLGGSKLTGKQLQKTPLEELFETTVQQIRQKRKGKRGMPSLKGEQFSDYQKKMIMEEFLSNEGVKRKIYEIIFEAENDKKSYLPNSFQPQGTKVKISFEDIT